MSIKASPAPEADLTIHLTVSEEAGTNFVAASEEGAKTMVLKKGATEVAFDCAHRERHQGRNRWQGHCHHRRQ